MYFFGTLMLVIFAFMNRNLNVNCYIFEPSKAYTNYKDTKCILGYDINVQIIREFVFYIVGLTNFLNSLMTNNF
jgi:hypothetical protein